MKLTKAQEHMLAFIARCGGEVLISTPGLHVATLRALYARELISFGGLEPIRHPDGRMYMTPTVIALTTN